MLENAGRPPGDRRASRTTTPTLAVQRHAELALRVAWLRVHGHYMFALDPTGQTSAQLWDFADLLETLDAEGRWDS